MGCLARLFSLFFWFSLSLLFLAFWGGIAFFDAGNQETASVALKTEVKELKQALEQDGPAWVKVKIFPASEKNLLECGGQPCLWKRKRGSEKYIEQIRLGGKWVTREVWKPVREDPQTVPIKFVARDAEVQVNDWIGIELFPDLLRVRNVSSTLLPEKPLPKIGKTEIYSDLREEFLPPYIEAWAFGKFVHGKPQVFQNDRFYLTGLGKERFATTFSTKLGSLKTFGTISGFLGAVFGILFFRKLLQ